MKRIDSLTEIIDTAILQMLSDSSRTKNETGQISFSSRENKFWYYDNNKTLKRIIWKVEATTILAKDTVVSMMASILYYDKERLIKVEQIENGSINKTPKKNQCYLEKDKIIYSLPPIERYDKESKEEKLIMVSKLFLKQFNDWKNKTNIISPTPLPSRSS